MILTFQKSLEEADQDLKLEMCYIYQAMSVESVKKCLILAT